MSMSLNQKKLARKAASNRNPLNLAALAGKGRRMLVLAAAAALGLSAVTAGSARATDVNASWTALVSGSWDLPANWSGAAVPANGGGNAYNVTIAPVSAETIDLNGMAASFTIGSLNLNSFGTIDNSAATLQTLIIDPASLAAQVATSIAGNIDGGAAGGIALQFGSGAAVTVNAAVSGNLLNKLSLTVDESGGIVTLSGTGNTYTGATTISAGTLEFTGSTAGLTGNVVDNAALVLNQTVNSSLSGIISGSGTVTQSGSAILTLSGLDTYTGTTTINSGTLKFTNDTVGVTGNVLDNAALVLNQTVNSSLSGIISGSGTVTQSGSAILTLSGLDTYTGQTTISGGTLEFTNNTVGVTGNVVDNAALVLNQTVNSSLSGIISGSGTVTQSGSAILTLSGLDTYTGQTTISGGTLEFTNNTVGVTGNVVDNAALVLNQTVNSSLSGIISGSGTVTQSGSAILTLSGLDTYTGTTTINAGTLEFTNNTVGVTGNVLDNAALVLNQTVNSSLSGIISGSGTVTQSGSAVLTLSGLDTYTGQTTISGGTLEFTNNTVGVTGNVVDNAALVLNQTVNSSLSGIISGSGTVTQSGSAVLTLSGLDTYTGQTTISGGTLEFTNNTVGVTGNVVDNAALVLNQTVNSSLSGIISGSGTVTQSGSAVLTLSGLDTYTGQTTISGGTLEFTNNTVGVTGNVVDNAALVLNQTVNSSLSGIISGSGTVTQSGSAILTLSGLDTYTGTTTINSGTLKFTNDTVGVTGNVLDNAALVLNQTVNSSLSGIISGSGTVTQSGSAVLTLSGLDTYTGQTTISGGTLEFTNNTVGVTGNVVDNAALVLNQTVNSSLSGIISGSGTVTQSGSAILTLSGLDTYTGQTTINAGTLALNATGSIADSSVALSTGAIFDISQTSGATILGLSGAGGTVALGSKALTVNLAGTDTFSGVIQDGGIGGGTGGSLVKSGGGTLTLGGANTYTGGSFLDLGTVSISAANNLGAAAGGITFNGGTLLTTAGITLANPITVNGGGGLINAGANNDILIGNISGAGALGLTNGSVEFNPSSGNNLAFTGTLDLNSLPGLITLLLDKQNAVTGGGITFNGGTLTNNSVGTLTFSIANALTVNSTGGTIDTNNQTNIFNGTITGTGALLIDGGGIAQLHGNSSATFSGPVTIDPTTVIFYNSGSLGSGTITLGPGGGELEAGATGVTLANNIVLSDALPADIYSTGSAGYSDTLSGVISGVGGGLMVTGGGTVNLNNANTYSGGTLITNNTTVGFNNNSSFGTGTIATDNTDATGGTLLYGLASLNIANPLTVGGTTIIDAGGFTNETYSGPITDTSGSTLTIQDGTVDLTSTSNSADFTTGNLQIGNGTGSSVVQFAYTSNLPAGTVPIILDQGNLQYIGAGNVTINNPITLNPGSNYIDVHGVTMYYTGPISGSGSLDAINSSGSSAGSLVLSNSESYSGATAVGLVGETQEVAMILAPGGSLSSLTDLSVAANGIFSIQNALGQTVNSLSGVAGSQIQLSSGNLAVTNGAGDIFAGAIQDGGSFTFNGVDAGTLTLTGANTYTGGTVVNNGTLALGIGGSLATGGNLTVNGPGGTFEINNVNGQTIGTLNGAGTTGTINLVTSADGLTVDNGGSFGGAIIGSGGLTLNAPNGSATLTLSGANTYTGLTTIGSGATLNLTGSLASNVLVSGGTLDVGATGSLAVTSSVALAGALFVNNSLFIQDLTGVAGSTITLSGNSNFTVNPRGSDTYAGTITGGTPASGLTVNGLGGGSLDITGSLTGYNGLTTIENGGKLGILLADLLPSTDAFAFFNNGTLNLFDGGTTTMGPINLGSSGTDVINGGGPTNTVILGGAITGSGTAVLQLENALFQLSPSGVQNNSGFTDQTLQIGDGSDLTVAQFATGNGADLPAATVGITLDQGTLQYTGSTAVTVGDAIAVTGALANVINAGGYALNLSGNLSGSSSLELTNGNVGLSGTNNSGFTGTLDLNNALGAVNAMVASSGALTGGGITFDGGTLTNSSGGALTLATTNALTVNSLGGTIDTDGQLTTLNGLISGGGPLTLTSSLVGSGTIAITAANGGFTGATTIDNGITVVLGASNALGNGAAGNNITINTSGGKLQYSAASLNVANNLDLAGNGIINVNGNTGTYSGVISGAGALAVIDSTNSNAVLTLTNAEQYTGGTTVGDGTGHAVTLTLGSGGSLASGNNLTLDANATVVVNNATGQTIGSLNGVGTISLVTSADGLTVDNGGTFGGAIIGAGGVALTGGGLILSGANTYSGGTSINGGTLDVTGSLLSTGNVNVTGGEFEVGSSFTIANLNGNSSGSLDLTGANVLTVNPSAADIFAGAVLGTGGLTVSGAGGSLNLSGDMSAFNGSLDATNGGSILVTGTGRLNSSVALNIANNLSIGVTYSNLNGNAVTFGSATATGGSLYITGTSGSSGTLGSAANAITIADTAAGTFTDLIDAGSGANTVNVAGALTSANATGANVLVLQNGIFNLTSANNSADFKDNGTMQIGAGPNLAATAEFASASNLPASTVGLALDAGTLQYTGAGSVTAGNNIAVTGAVGNVINANGLSGGNALTLSGNLSGSSSAVLELTHGNVELSGTNNSFAGTLDLNNSLGAVNALVHSQTALTGGGITFDGGTLTNSSGTHLTIANNLLVNSTGGTFNDNGGGNPITPTVLNGNITGLGTFTIAGSTAASDFVALAGTNSPAGFVFQNVTAQVSSANNLGTNPITLNNAAILGTASFTSANNLQLLGVGDGLAVGGAVTDVYSGVIGGPAALTLTTGVSGTGVIELANTNSYGTSALGTTVENGVTAEFNADGSFGGNPIQIGAAGSIGGQLLPTLSGLTLSNNITLHDALGTLAVSDVYNTNNTATTLDGTISGPGGLLVNGDGVVTLSGTNTYSGGTIIDAPTTVIFTNSSSLGSGVITLGPGGGTLEAGATGVTLANNMVLSDALISGTPDIYSTGSSIYTDTLSGIISSTGTGGLLITGGGTVKLNGINTYIGGTLVTNKTTVGFNNNSSFGTAGIIIGASALDSGALQAETGNAALTLANSLTLTGSALFDPNAASTTLTGLVSGAGSLLVKDSSGLGTGLLILTNANTYTGQTTIKSGTLEFTGDTSLVTGNVLDYSALVFDQTANSSLSGAISGTGTVTQSGTAILTLSGLDTYTGLTTINSGTLEFTQDTTGVTGNVLDNANLILSQTVNSVLSGIISGSGTVTQAGSAILTLSGLDTYTGQTTINSGTLEFTNDTSNLTGPVVDNGALVLHQTVNSSLSGIISGSGTVTQSGAATLTLSGLDTYTGQTTINSGMLEFTNNTVGVTGNVVDNSALVLDQTVASSLSGAISGSGTVTQSGSAILTLSGLDTYTGQTNINSGTLEFTNNTVGVTGNVLDNSALVFDQTVNSSLSGIISGTGTVTQSGSAILTLSGNNIYGGTTTINSGTLEFTGSTAGLTGNVLDNSALVFDQSTASSLSGAISGTGAVTQSGAAILTLSGNNTYGGLTTISSGTLEFTGSTAGLAGNVLDNSALVFDQSTASSLSGIISGGGTVTQSGAAILTLSGLDTYTGQTTINSGTLEFTNDTVGVTGNVLDNSALVLNQSVNSSLSGVISGTGTVTQSGSAILTLSGNNTYGGLTTISSGTLEFTGSTAGLTGNVLDNSALVFDQTANSSLSGVISGSGTVTQSGSAILTLSNVNTYSGATTINGTGTLALLGSGSIAASSGVALTTAGATLDISQTSGTTILGLSGVGGTKVALGAQALTVNLSGGTDSFAGVIQNGGLGGGIGGSLIKTGAGTLTLSGNNTYSGGTSITGGTLDVTGSLLNTGNVSVTAGEFEVGNSFTIANLNGDTGSTLNLLVGNILTVNPSTADIFAGAVIGGGGLTVNGTGGSLDLSGNMSLFTGALDATNGGSIWVTSSSQLSNLVTLAIANNLSIGVGYSNLNGNNVTFSANTASGFLNVTGTPGSGGTLGTVGITDTTGTTSNVIDAGGAGNTLTLGAITSAGSGDNTLLLRNGIFNLAGTSDVSFATGTLQIGAGPNLAATAEFANGNQLPATAVGITLDAGTLQYTGSSSAATNSNITVTGAGNVINVGGVANALILGGHLIGGSTAALELTNGNVVLSGTNGGFTGTLDLNNALGAANAIVTSQVALTGGGITFDGGTLTNNSGTALTLANALTVNSLGGTFNDAGGGTAGLPTALNGDITGLGTFTIAGSTAASDFVTLAGTNSPGTGSTPGFIFQNVTARVSSAANLGSNQINLVNAAILGTATFTSSNNLQLQGGSDSLAVGGAFTDTYQGIIGGPAALVLTTTFAGSGVIDLVNNANSYGTSTLGTTVENGVTAEFNADGSFGGNPIQIGAAGNIGGQLLPSVSGLILSNNIALNDPLSGLVATSDVYNTNLTTTTLDGIISGSGGLFVNGGGTVTLNGVNTYTGGTIIDPTTVIFTNSSSLGTGTITLGVGGGTLEAGATGVTLTNNIVLSDALSLDVYSTGLATNIDTLGGNISDALGAHGGLMITGGGTVNLNGPNNTYSGGTLIVSGTTVGFDHAGSFGTAGITIGASASDSGELQAETGNGFLSLANSLTLTGNGLFDTNAAITALNGVVSGAGSLTVNDSSGLGTGMLVLANANTYGNSTLGTLIENDATVEFGTGTSLGTDLIVMGGSGAPGATLMAGRTGQTLSNNIQLNDVITGRNSDIFNTNTDSTTLTGTVSGSGGLVVDGDGRLTLNPASSANTYSGGTTINSATVAVGASGDADLGWAGGVLTLNSGTLDVTAATQFITARTVTLAGAGTIVNGNTAALATFQGVISGPGAMTLTGGGPILFNAANSYLGGTGVTGGTTAVAGSSTAFGSGNLSVTGSTVDTLNSYNYNTLGTTASGLTLKVGGYSQDSASTLNLVAFGRPVIGQATSGTYDSLALGAGAVNLNGTLNLEFSSAVNPAFTHPADFDTYTVVATTGANNGTTAKGGLTPTAHGATPIEHGGSTYGTGWYQINPASTNMDLNYYEFDPSGNQNVAIQTLFYPYAVTPNEKSVALYIDLNDTPFSNVPLNLQTGLANLSLLNPGQIAQTLNELTPQAYSQLQNQSIINNTFLAQEVFGQVQNAFEDGGFNTSGLTLLKTNDQNPFAVSMDAAMQSAQQQAKNSVSYLDDPGLPQPIIGMSGSSPAVPARESYRRLSGFVLGTVALDQLPQQDGGATQHFTTGGILAGLDYRLNRHLMVGALFNYGYTGGTMDNVGSQQQSSSYTPGVFVGYNKGGFYADGLMSYTYNSYKINRNIDIPGSSSTATGKPDSNEYDANALLGYYLPITKGFKIGPAAGVGFTQVNTSGFSETGSPFDLSVSKKHADSLRSLLGMQGQLTIAPVNDPLPINISFNAFWQHEFLDSASTTTASFSELGGSGSFIYNNAGPSARNSALVGLGVNGYIAKQVSLFVNYEAQIGTNSQIDQTVMAGVAVNFEVMEVENGGFTGKNHKVAGDAPIAAGAAGLQRNCFGHGYTQPVGGQGKIRSLKLGGTGAQADASWGDNDAPGQIGMH